MYVEKQRIIYIFIGTIFLIASVVFKHNAIYASFLLLPYLTYGGLIKNKQAYLATLSVIIMSPICVLASHDIAHHSNIYNSLAVSTKHSIGIYSLATWTSILFLTSIYSLLIQNIRGKVFAMNNIVVYLLIGLSSLACGLSIAKQGSGLYNIIPFIMILLFCIDIFDSHFEKKKICNLSLKPEVIICLLVFGPIPLANFPKLRPFSAINIKNDHIYHEAYSELCDLINEYSLDSPIKISVLDPANRHFPSYCPKLPIINQLSHTSRMAIEELSAYEAMPKIYRRMTQKNKEITTLLFKSNLKALGLTAYGVSYEYLYNQVSNNQPSQKTKYWSVYDTSIIHDKDD